MVETQERWHSSSSGYVASKPRDPSLEAARDNLKFLGATPEH